MEGSAPTVLGTANARSQTTGPRLMAAILCGIVAGFLLPNSLQVGFRFHFGNEPDWGLLLWGEHWVLRVGASLISAVSAGALAGAIARDRAQLVGSVVGAPAAMTWLFVAVSGWREAFLFTEAPVYISIGNKLAASALGFLLVPACRAGARIGQQFGQAHSRHFDSRRGTLLGVKWYHYVWLPLPIHLLLVQASWAGLYGFQWLKVSWRAGANPFVFLPTIFVLMMWGTFIVLGKGTKQAYRVLAGFEPVMSARARAVAVMKYGLGFPLLAWVLQAGVMLLHYALAQLAD